MKRTSKLGEIFFYVFYSLIALYSNKLKGQYNISNFFDKEKSIAQNYCHTELKENKDYLYVKSIKDTILIKLLESNCGVIAETYSNYERNTFDLIHQNISNESDFIIINMDIKSVYYPSPILSVMKIKNKNKLHTIHYDYGYDEISKKSYRITDSLITIDHIEGKMSVLEDYFYSKKLNDKIFKNQKKALKKYNYQYIKTYFIVARISGKIITQKIYFVDDHN